MWNGITLISGILLLYLGAEWLIKGAAGLGRSFGIRPLVVGLTVVAYGTSAPEFIVSLVAGSKGMSNLALGNVIGSNLANLGLVLGMTAILAPLAVDGSLIRREAPAMFATGLLIPMLLAHEVVSRTEGLVLVVLAGLFTYAAARSSRREREDKPKKNHSTIEGRGSSRRASGEDKAPPDWHCGLRSDFTHRRRAGFCEWRSWFSSRLWTEPARNRIDSRRDWDLNTRVGGFNYCRSERASVDRRRKCNRLEHIQRSVCSGRRLCHSSDQRIRRWIPARSGLPRRAISGGADSGSRPAADPTF